MNIRDASVGSASGNGSADGDFALASGGAREQQIGDVGAGDQQDKTDRTE